LYNNVPNLFHIANERIIMKIFFLYSYDFWKLITTNSCYWICKLFRSTAKDSCYAILSFLIICWIGANQLVVYASPENGVVTAGSAVILTSPNYTEVVQHTEKAVIDWGRFDLAVNEHTHFYLAMELP
jgi:hypothetical protein